LPRLRLFYETELRAIALPHGLVWTTDEVLGGAVWAPPLQWRVPARATIREMPPMVRVFGRRLPLAFRTRLKVEGKHPRNPAIGISRSWASHPIRREEGSAPS